MVASKRSFLLLVLASHFGGDMSIMASLRGTVSWKLAYKVGRTAFSAPGTLCELSRLSASQCTLQPHSSRLVRLQYPFIAAETFSSTIEVWNIATLQRVGVVPFCEHSQLNLVLLSQDKPFLFYYSPSGGLNINNWESGETRLLSPDRTRYSWGYHEGDILVIMEVMASGILLRSWRTDTWEPLHNVTAPERGWDYNGGRNYAIARMDGEGRILFLPHIYFPSRNDGKDPTNYIFTNAPDKDVVFFPVFRISKSGVEFNDQELPRCNDIRFGSAKHDLTIYTLESHSILNRVQRLYKYRFNEPKELVGLVDQDSASESPSCCLAFDSTTLTYTTEPPYCNYFDVPAKNRGPKDRIQFKFNDRAAYMQLNSYQRVSCYRFVVLDLSREITAHLFRITPCTINAEL